MMKTFGIYRIYYTNENGDLCYQKITDIGNSSNQVNHVTYGLTELITLNKSARLPLTRKEKIKLGLIIIKIDKTKRKKVTKFKK